MVLQQLGITSFMLEMRRDVPVARPVCTEKLRRFSRPAEIMGEHDQRKRNREGQQDSRSSPERCGFLLHRTIQIVHARSGYGWEAGPESPFRATLTRPIATAPMAINATEPDSDPFGPSSLPAGFV